MIQEKKLENPPTPPMGTMLELENFHYQHMRIHQNHPK